MKKSFLIIGVGIIILAVVILLFILIPKQNEVVPDVTNPTTNSQTNPTDSTNPTTPSDTDSTEPTEKDEWADLKASLDSDELIRGIPKRNFIHTVGREFNFVLKYKPTGDTIDLERKENPVTFTDFCNKYPFLFKPTMEDPEFIIEPDTTQMQILFEAQNEDDPSRLLLAMLNETDETVHSYDDLAVTFLSFLGNKDWEFCGLTVDMNKEAVYSKIGEPLQMSVYENSCYMEYYILKNDNVYVLMVIMDKDQTYIQEIILNVNNYSIH